MITDKDVTKLKKTFATKEDIKTLSKDIHTVINMVGESFKKDSEQDSILDNHERRLDKIENKVFSTN